MSIALVFLVVVVVVVVFFLQEMTVKAFMSNILLNSVPPSLWGAARHLE